MAICGKHILRKDGKDKDPKVGVCAKCFRIRKKVMIRRKEERSRREVRQGVEAGSGGQFCTEPRDALVRTSGFTLSEMRTCKKVLSRGVTWSDLCHSS